MEQNSTSHSRGVGLNSQPEKRISRLGLYVEFLFTSRQMSIFQS